MVKFDLGVIFFGVYHPTLPLSDRILSLNFTQLIKTYTRYDKPTKTNSILDQIWVNCPLKVVSTDAKLVGSDHKSITSV